MRYEEMGVDPEEPVLNSAGVTPELTPRSIPAPEMHAPEIRGGRARSAHARSTPALPLLRAMRPKQWLKNLLVFAAPGAAAMLGRGPVLTRASLAFVVFCLVSSGLYLVNDVLDAPLDRLHPLKRRRPIAAGQVSSRAALVAATALVIVGVGLSLTLGSQFALAVDAYLAIALAYSLLLKRLPAVDILAVAAGFVIRALAGGLATGIPDSEWFLLLVSLGALFVVTGKRYADLQAPGLETGRGSLPSRSGGPISRYLVSWTEGKAIYNRRFLRVSALVFSAGSMAAYVGWVLGPHTRAYGHLIPFSIIPFALAVGRYTFLVELKQGGAPEDLFTKDRPLQLAVLAWVVVYGSGIYLA